MKEVLIGIALFVAVIAWCFLEAAPYSGKGPYPEKWMMVTPRQAMHK